MNIAIYDKDAKFVKDKYYELISMDIDELCYVLQYTNLKVLLEAAKGNGIIFDYILVNEENQKKLLAIKPPLKQIIVSTTWFFML